MATPTSTEVADTRAPLEGGGERRAQPSSPSSPSPAAVPFAARSGRRWSTWLGWLLPILVVASGAFGYWRYAQKHKAPEIAFKTSPVETRKIVGRVTASGTLQALVTV